MLAMLAAVPGRALAQAPAVAVVADDALEQGFKTPPDSAKPRVWWHWLNGNVTKEGITADLEWMERVGIGGFQMFDGSLGVPQFTEKRLVWMTPEWKDAFRHAAAEADRLGLEMSMATSGGWSETAGPWVKPEEAMKKVVWTETRVEGPRRFSGALPAPPSVNGYFQDVPPPPGFDFPEPKDLPGAKPAQQAPAPPPDPTYYADTKVIAYRVPDGELRMSDARPRLTSSAPGVDLSGLTDGDLRKAVAIPYLEGGKQAWIQFEFAEPFRAQAFTFAAPTGLQFFGTPIPEGQVQASQDGATWSTLVSLPGPGHPFASFMVRTYSFPETTAKYFRVSLTPAPPNPMLALFGAPPNTKFDVTELELHSGPRVNRWQEKAAYGNMVDFDAAGTPPVPEGQAVARGDVLDLTSKMREAGTLDWDVPAGKWVVLRMGYSLTGEKNHPATPEATGFEVDKLSRKHVASYVKTYADMISEAAGPHFGKSFRYFLMDSWEAGLENWTDDMIEQFRARRGYDPTPYLPALTGRVVGSADVSDRFLWDYRRTIADLLAENHYRAATDYFHSRGVGLYAEAMGAALPTTGDGLLNKGMVDIPMGEFWTPSPGQRDTPDHASDVREAASAAHIYGKRIVGAEAFTTMPPNPVWASPYYLKKLADENLARGINRFIFHTSDHQPFVDERHKPGITLAIFGQHYTRNNTWGEQSVAFDTYLARSSYLLQQGLYVGDVAYFYGEGAPVAVPFWKTVTPAPPAGYGYDYLNADVLLNRASVKDGRIVLADGMSYRVLVLPEYVDELTLPVARKVRDLVAAGATVIAPRPKGSPSLAGFPASDDEIRAIATEVWGPIDGKGVTEHAYGRGAVYWGRSVDDVLASQTTPDVEFQSSGADSELVWIHRRSGDADIYFVANQKERPEDVTATFRVDGKEAELWHPDTGETEPADYSIANGRTTVPLRLDPTGSVFVVFRGTAASPSRTLPRPASTALATLEGPWTVSFPANWGAPPQITLDRLASWTASADAGVKYFSGTAVYTKDVDVPKEWLRPGAKVVLDLGTVREIAEVSVNGRPLGVLWKPPYSADVTSALKPGPNRLEIKVTNLWPNRVIGDLQPDTKQRYTFLDYRPFEFTKDTPPLESGLLGPVRVVAVTGR